MHFVYILLAIVLLGVGATLLPPIKAVTTAIFDSFGILETAPLFLGLMVSFWPVWLLLAFVVGAFFLVKRS